MKTKTKVLGLLIFMGLALTFSACNSNRKAVPCPAYNSELQIDPNDNGQLTWIVSPEFDFAQGKTYHAQ